MILLDASGVFAALNDRERHHADSLAVLHGFEPPLLLSPFVLAELDYLIRATAGVDAELALLEDVARGSYQLEEFSAADVREAADVITGHRDLGVGLADASIVVLSRRHGIIDLLTLDERHFRVLRGARDRPFRLLPADA